MSKYTRRSENFRNLLTVAGHSNIEIDIDNIYIQYKKGTRK